MTFTIDDHYKTKKTSDDPEFNAEEKKDDVLKFIIEKGVAYPTEICREMGVHIETINRVISLLIKLGYIKRIIPDRWHPQPMFNGRMNEFWSDGIDSYDKLNRRTWWMPTLGGIEYVKAKFYNQKVQIKGSLLRYYGLEVKNGYNS